MTQVSAIDVNRKATYNAVKIQVNNPQANIANGFKTSPEDNGTYNAVTIEVNNPKIQAGKKHHHGIYDYPCAECMVTSELAPIHAVSLPKLPVYQTTNFINNKTLINAELGQKNSSKEIEKAIVEKNAMPEVETLVIEKTVTVPLPNLTTVEEQKLNPDKKVSFNGRTSSFNTSYFCWYFLPMGYMMCHLENNNSGKHYVPSRMYEDYKKIA